MNTIIYYMQIEKSESQLSPERLFIEGYHHSVWSKYEEKSTEKEECTNKGESTDKKIN